MEEIVDLFADIVLPEITYQAVYDPETLRVSIVGPSHALQNYEHKLDIDSTTALSIIEGKILITSCCADIIGNELKISEEKTLFKIDDLLHRIQEKRFSNKEWADIWVEYNRKNKTITVKLTEEFQGTKKVPEKLLPLKKRALIWKGTTAIDLLITDYNDPNIVYEHLSLTVEDLIGKNKIFKNIDAPENFSVYTKRLFADYLLETK